MNNQKIPTSWAEVTLDQWHRILSLPKGLSDQERSMRTAAIVISTKISDIRALSMSEWTKLCDQLQFTNEAPKQILKKEYEINGSKLRLCDMSSELTVGMFIDLEEDIAQENLLSLIGRIYRPVDADGNMKPYDGLSRKELLGPVMTVEEVSGVSAYFMTLVGLSSLLMERSSLIQQKKTSTQERPTSNGKKD